MDKRLKTDIVHHIRQNFLLYIIILFVILTGFTSGIFTAGAMSESQQLSLGSYMEQFFYTLGNEPIQRGAIFWSSVWQHFKLVFFIWLSGLVFFGIPVIFLLAGIRGFIIGFTVGFIVGCYNFGGFLFTLLCIFPQAIIYLPCYMGICVIAFANSFRKIKNWKVSYNREQYIKSILPYTLKILLLFLVILFSSIVEAFVTPVFFGMFKFVFI